MGMARSFLAGGVVLALACPVWAGGPIEITDAKDKQIVESFLKHVDTVPQEITADSCKKKAADEAEGFTWEINPFAAMPLTAYEMTGDVKYLDMFVQVFDAMRSALTTGPGGYLDWYGKPLPIFRDPARPGLEGAGDGQRLLDQRDSRAFCGARAGGPGPRGASSATKPRSISIWPNTSSSASGRPAAISWTSAGPARSSGQNPDCST